LEPGVHSANASIFGCTVSLEIESGLSGERLDVRDLGLIAEGIAKEQIKIMGREAPRKLLMG
jgi:hypothetical protein